MDKSEQIRIAILTVDKSYSYEDLHYSDYMYGKGSYTDNVWEYVTEIKDYGMISFKEKYEDQLET